MSINIGTGFITVAPRVDVSRFATSIGASFAGINRSVGNSALKTGALLTAGITLPIVGMAKAAVSSAITFESALAGVAKTVGDVTSIADPLIVGLGKEIQEIANVTPIAAEELLKIGEIAGQLGVEAEKIPSFAKKVAEIALSTDLTSESAAFSLARFANVLGDGTDAVGRYSDSLIALGNKFPTTESQILSLSSRIAGAGATVGIAAEDILGIATALSSVGVTAELGGTAVQRVIISMASAADEGGEKLEGFAKVAGLSAEQFALAFKQDAAGAFVEFIKGLGDMQAEGGPLFKTLDDLGFGGIRVQQVLLRAAGASDIMASAMDTANNSAGALAIEVEKRFSTTESVLTTAGNNIKALFQQFGESALPIVKFLAEGVGKLANVLQGIPGPLKIAIGLFSLLAAAAGPVLLMVGGFIHLAANLAIYRAATGAATRATNQQTAASSRLASVLKLQSLATTGASVANSGLAQSVIPVTRSSLGTRAAFGGYSGMNVSSLAYTPKVGRLASGLNKMKPTMKNVGTGLGVALGASLAAGFVNSIDTEEQTMGRAVQTTVSSALAGAGLGGLIGSLFTPVGAAVGAGVGGALGAGFGLIKSEIDAVVFEAQLSADEIVGIFADMGLGVDEVTSRFKIAATGIGDTAGVWAEALKPIVSELTQIASDFGNDAAQDRLREIAFAFVSSQDPSRTPEEIAKDLQTLLFQIDQYTPTIRFSIDTKDLSDPESFINLLGQQIGDLQTDWLGFKFGSRRGPFAETTPERKKWEADITGLVDNLATLGERQGLPRVVDVLTQMNEEGIVTPGILERIYEDLALLVATSVGLEGMFDRDNIGNSEDFLSFMREMGVLSEGITGDALELERLGSSRVVPDVGEEFVKGGQDYQKYLEEYLAGEQLRKETIAEMTQAVPIGVTSYDIEFNFEDAQTALDNFNTSISTVASGWFRTMSSLDISDETKAALTQELTIPARAEFISMTPEAQQKYIDSIEEGMALSGWLALIDTELVSPGLIDIEEFITGVSSDMEAGGVAIKPPVEFDPEIALFNIRNTIAEIEPQVAPIQVPINFIIGDLPPLPKPGPIRVGLETAPTSTTTVIIRDSVTSDVTRDAQKAGAILSATTGFAV